VEEINVNEIIYFLTRKKVKNIILKINARGQILVSANPRVSKDEINRFILKKYNWIIKHLARIKKIREANLPKRYVCGESFFYLGRLYALRVVEGKKQAAALDGDNLILQLKDVNNFEKKRQILNSWFKKQALIVLTEMFEAVRGRYNFANKFTLKMRLMKARWGSFNVKTNVITLNTNLICAPPHCIEYVMAHELCHSVVADHSKRFYELLAAILPSWKDCKRELGAKKYTFL
jgi:hypothetical protein